jgi:hypothetical protein
MEQKAEKSSWDRVVQGWKEGEEGTVGWVEAVGWDRRGTCPSLPDQSEGKGVAGVFIRTNFGWAWLCLRAVCSRNINLEVRVDAGLC